MSVEAEMAAIGALILEPLEMVAAARRMKLTPDCFGKQAHKVIVKRMFEMFDDGDCVDLLTLGNAVVSAGEEEKIGGRQYLENCVDACVTAAHGLSYLDQVRQAFILRRIQEECLRIGSEANREQHGDEFLKKIPARFMAIMEDVVEVQDNRAVMERVYQNWQDVHAGLVTSGLPLPWERLHKLMGGLCPGLIIVAGRPSAGKTTFEDNVASFLGSQGKVVGRVTMDMTHERLMARAMSRKSGVSIPKLKFGFAGEANLAKVKDAIDVLDDYKIHINDMDSDLRSILTWARAMKMRHNMDVLTVDYVQQIVDSDATAYTSEHQVITKTSRAFKRLAKELNIPVILLSQLNREVAKGDRPPKMSDLRGSGSLEQDASVIVLMYRDPRIPIEEDKKSHMRPVWCDVVKHQDGETGAIELWLYHNYFLFEQANEGAFDRLHEEIEEG